MACPGATLTGNGVYTRAQADEFLSALDFTPAEIAEALYVVEVRGFIAVADFAAALAGLLGEPPTAESTFPDGSDDSPENENNRPPESGDQAHRLQRPQPTISWLRIHPDALNRLYAVRRRTWYTAAR